MKRIEAIKEILNNVDEKDIVVTSAGRISRETYYVKDRLRNFYVQGSMGATVGIGIGLAICNPERQVFVIVGDGDILINLDNLVVLKKLQKEGEIDNLQLYILDNKQYQSTGGQPTVSDVIDFRTLCWCKTIFVSDSEIDVPRIDIPHVELKRRFVNALRE